ncbi:hypothetical protein SNE25_10040 [Mucilaginibacter sabulilitoris]|uniref:Fibronectin type-III domain-containing protein n=1 Tax=Mucilaginibacter sabulilitoris TaxID=1173583 RepID=A0ABZ0TTQ5_9SPHI|nr:hypothetical protein [Mucilaginibacter sabulilitoris]WPU95857.1 hypothetical protein SNE25_10040 [Mucilaginibacter sabulilitoris]
MKLKLLPLLLFTLLLLAEILPSCKEFIEPSISKRTMQLNAPADHYQSTSYTANFWWEGLEDALYYRLQVVTPTFDSIGSLVQDTLIRGTKFSQTLDPGTYQWRVRAENGSSQTGYTAPRELTILASTLTNQTVLLSSPANNTVTTQSAVTFKWGSLYKATRYHLQVDTNSFASESTLVSDQVIPGQQFAFKLPKDQVYQWRVRAENDSSQSKWSAISQLSFDSTPPGNVTLIQPGDNTTLNRPVALSWNKTTSAVTYKLYIYKSDQSTLYDTFPLSLTVTSYTFNTGNSGDRVYWQVSAVDAAGNEGKASAIRSFTLQ